jgi:anti-sigma B factor antagonist
MSIQTRNVHGVTILDIQGRITIGEESALIRTTIRSLVESGQKSLLLNLADVRTVDSTGIGELVSSYTHVADQGGALKLLHLTKRTRELLAITKLLTVFDTFEDETQAVASFA